MLHGWLACGSVATERGIHRRVDPFVKGPLAGLFGLPYLDVAQGAVRLAYAQMQR